MPKVRAQVRDVETQCSVFVADHTSQARRRLLAYIGLGVNQIVIGNYLQHRTFTLSRRLLTNVQLLAMAIGVDSFLIRDLVVVVQLP